MDSLQLFKAALKSDEISDTLYDVIDCFSLNPTAIIKVAEKNHKNALLYQPTAFLVKVSTLSLRC